MSLKIYLAGKYSDYKEIHEKMSALEKMGHSITFKWTKNVDKKLNNPSTFDIVQSAKDDFKGVQDCDLLIVLFTDSNYAYRGTSTELGIALALNKKIYMVCPKDSSVHTNVFTHLPSIEHFEDYASMLKKLPTKEESKT